MAGSPEPCESFFMSATRWPFDKHGMVNSHIDQVCPDAAGLSDRRERKDTRSHVMPPSGCARRWRWVRVTSNATANDSAIGRTALDRNALTDSKSGVH